MISLERVVDTSTIALLLAHLYPSLDDWHWWAIGATWLVISLAARRWDESREGRS